MSAIDLTNANLDLFLLGALCVLAVLAVLAIHLIGEWRVHRQVPKRGTRRYRQQQQDWEWPEGCPWPGRQQ